MFEWVETGYSESEITKIVTHEYPDFDCLYAIYLLQKFGEKKYPSVLYAELAFVPDGGLPGNKSSDQLLSKGCLTVDLQGGHFNH